MSNVTHVGKMKLASFGDADGLLLVDFDGREGVVMHADHLAAVEYVPRGGPRTRGEGAPIGNKATSGVHIRPIRSNSTDRAVSPAW